MATLGPLRRCPRVNWRRLLGAIRDMAGGIHWKSISRFESHDFVARWYRKAHGRSAGASKVAQINACFAHGREYFRNAERSEMSVKPLLLYYGVLSWLPRRGTGETIPTRRKKSLKPRHGIETVDWQGTLSGGIKNLLELRIRATNGTFGELVDVCSHLNTLHLFSGPTNQIGSTGQRYWATSASQRTGASCRSANCCRVCCKRGWLSRS